MIGYHCKLAIGKVIGSFQFFPLFDFLWVRMIEWFPATIDCLQGGLI